MKRIFIGSSSNALEQATQVETVLRDVEGVEPVLWPTIFRPSFLTLQAIESMMDSVAGAVLLAAPDDRQKRKRATVTVPRSNVIFELGLLSARIGRPNIALCRYDHVDLLTDLDSFTYIPMGPFPKAKTQRKIPPPARELIQSWAASLMSTVPGLSRTSLLHGSSGRWNVLVDFSRWRGRRIEAGEKVSVLGYLDLWIPADGSAGHGVAHGTLTLELRHPKRRQSNPYASWIQVVDRIDHVRCTAQGGLTFQSETFSRFVDRERGDVPPLDGVQPRLPGPTRFEWNLSIDAHHPKRLLGSYGILGDSRDAARVSAWRG